MNKKLLILVAILVILLIIIITMGIFSFFNKNKPKIVETKTFSEISGFSFEYPVFRGWEVIGIKKDNEDGCNIVFNNPTGKELFVSPTIMVVKNNLLVNKAIPSRSIGDVPFDISTQKKNANNISYAIGNRDGIEALEFYTDNFGVSIQTFFPSEFDKKALLNKIIETFKFEK